jgi:nucleoid-associated protein YgaU
VPVSDQDFLAAQQAIAEAEAVEADKYSPDLLNQARQALTEAHTKASSDPDAARSLLKISIEKAHEARDAASAARTKAVLDRLDQAVERLKALQAALWDPDGTSTVLAQADEARAAFLKDYSTGLPLANDAISALDGATSKLEARLLAVQDLRLQAQNALDAAEKADAFVWVPDLVQSADDAFFQGTGAWKKYRLDAAEESWSTALFQAKSASAKAQEAMERKRTEQLMIETMKKLEDASGKTVVDPQDRIIAPQPWDGTKELDQLEAKPVSVLIPSDGSVVVLADKQRVTYLDEAKDQWAQGVKAFNAGDLPLANECFLQAQKLVDTYLAMAVDKVYTVRLIPERRDSLWRISEYKEIFSSPWDWPKIWKRNQKLIQNPDLIYPGWQLIIPPQ